MALLSARTQFEKQTRWARNRNNPTYEKLLRIGLEKQDEEIYLSDLTSAVDLPSGQPKGRRQGRLSYYLAQLTKKDHGAILEKIASNGKMSYRFKNPLLRAYLKKELTQKNSETAKTLTTPSRQPATATKTAKDILSGKSTSMKRAPRKWKPRTNGSLPLLD